MFRTQVLNYFFDIFLVSSEFCCYAWIIGNEFGLGNRWSWQTRSNIETRCWTPTEHRSTKSAAEMSTGKLNHFFTPHLDWKSENTHFSRRNCTDRTKKMFHFFHLIEWRVNYIRLFDCISRSKVESHRINFFSSKETKLGKEQKWNNISCWTKWTILRFYERKEKERSVLWPDQLLFKLKVLTVFALKHWNESSFCRS